jgi:hypothetical protein
MSEPLDGGLPSGGTGSGHGSAGGSGSGHGSASGTGSGHGSSSSGSGHGSSSGSGSGSGSGSCTFCNADNQAAVGRGSQNANATAAPDRSPCLPDGPLQAFTISNIRPYADKAMAQLNARVATWQFQPAIVAANAAGFVVGVGPGVDIGVLHGWSGGAGYYFAPGNVVGVYGSLAEDDGLFYGADVGLSFIVIYGMNNFSGPGYAIGGALKVGIGGSLALTFGCDADGNTDLHKPTGYCAALGFGFSAAFFAQLSHTYVSPPS